MNRLKDWREPLKDSSTTDFLRCMFNECDREAGMFVAVGELAVDRTFPYNFSLWFDEGVDRGR